MIWTMHEVEEAEMVNLASVIEKIQSRFISLVPKRLMPAHITDLFSDLKISGVVPIDDCFSWLENNQPISAL